MVINTKFTALEYAAMSDALASGFFYSDGEYAHHAGMLNAMLLFYNNCVTESKFDEQIPHNTESLSDLNVLAADEEFIEAFNKALVADHYRPDFANAYHAALEIVNVRRSSLNYAVEKLLNRLNEFADKFSPSLSEETLKVLDDISKQFAQGKALPEAIVNEYIKSGRLKELVEKAKEISK